MLTETLSIIVILINLIFIIGIIRVLIYLSALSHTKHIRKVNTKPYLLILTVWLYKLTLVVIALLYPTEIVTYIGYLYVVKELCTVAVISYYIKYILTNRDYIRIPFTFKTKLILWYTQQ